MAFMHPEDIENYKHTGSELKMYCALKDQLPEKDHVFFSVRWFDQVDGKRIDSECDFLVFDPGFGFLTIECKGGTDINIENNIWTLTERDEEGNISKRELKKSPFAQAENSMRYFYDYFSKEFLQTFNGVYGFAVAFPNYSIDQKIECAAEENLIIDLRHMNQLSHRINEIFHYWRVRNNNRVPFSADQKSRFIKLVNKRISLSAAAGALIPIKEKEFEKINLIQDSIIDFLTNYKQVQIVGGAGTGKTYIAMKKCSRLLNSELDVLYVCKSVELAKFVKSNIVDNRFSSRSFDDLIIDITGRDDLSNIESYFDEVDRNTKKKYDAVVIGAGNGGLTAAARLAKEGKKVALLEQHNMPGGFATSFVRGRFEFEPSLHELCDFGSSEKPGAVRELFDDLGVSLEWCSISEAFRTILTDDSHKRDFTMPFGTKAFVDKKVSEMVSVIKNFILKVFKKNNSDDEDTKIDDDKKIFNLKTILQKIIRKKKKKHEHDAENL